MNDENRMVKVPIEKYDELIRCSEKVNILIRSIAEHGHVWTGDDIVRFFEL